MKKNREKDLRNSGQMLIEVIVATAVVVLLVMGLIAGTSAALKASQNARRRSMATQLTQEGMEYIRNLRDQNWTNFQNLTSVINPAYYCLNALNTIPVLDPSPPATCTDNITITEGTMTYKFSRKADFTWNAADKYMGVIMHVTWPEGNATRESKSETRLTNWR